MRLMLVSDFAQMKRGIASTLLVCLFISAVTTISTDSPIAGAAAVAVAFPYMVIFSVLANDEVAGWARYRETMPLSRRDVVLGRYAGTLIVTMTGYVLAIALSFAVGTMLDVMGIGGGLQGFGAEGGMLAELAFLTALGFAAALVMPSVILPVIMLFGLTRATRIFPLIFVLVFVFCGALSMTPDVGNAFFAGSVSWLSIGFGVVFAAFALFVASAFVTCRFYELREF